MAEYSMDEHENILKQPATVEDLAKWANEYQTRYFAGFDPAITIRIVAGSAQGPCFMLALGLICVPESLTRFEKCCRIILLHEIIHINLHLQTGDADPEHGVRFEAEILRIFSQGGYRALL